MDSNTPRVSRLRSISPVWIVPIVAACIALFLLYQSWRDQGPVVSISFEQAEGIESGRTSIRYKDVVVGSVENVRVSQDLSRVIVTAELAREFSQYLSSDTKFWIVSPKVSLAGVSGLGTLFSGVYIEMDVGDTTTQKPARANFKGLEEPPRILSNAAGKNVTLISQSLGSLGLGSPVYYKKIPVGEITGYRLDAERGVVEINVFVNAPFDTLVGDDTRFWNVSGVGFDLNADGINVEVESFNALIAGGVAFQNFNNIDNVTLKKDTYYLSPDYESISQADFANGQKFWLKFEGQSVRGLAVDSPVEYAGIQVGRVTHIRLKREDNTPFVSVSIELYPTRFGFDDSATAQVFTPFIDNLLNRGFRAQLKNGSLITGSLIIDLVKTQETGENFLANASRMIPTTSSSVEKITQQIASISSKLDGIPISDISQNLNTSLSEFSQLMAQLNKGRFAESASATANTVSQASRKLDALLQQASNSIDSVQSLMQTMEYSIAPDSALYYELLKSLKSMGESADSIRTLTDELNRHPQSLILGKEAR